MKKHKPTLPAAHTALYGDHSQPEHEPQDRSELALSLFLQLDIEEKRKVNRFMRALRDGDTETTDRMTREAQEELAYQQLERELQGERTSDQLQQDIERDLSGGAV